MNNGFVDRCFFGCVGLIKGDICNFLMELIIINVNDNDVKKNNNFVLFLYYYYLLEIVYCGVFFLIMEMIKNFVVFCRIICFILYGLFFCFFIIILICNFV